MENQDELKRKIQEEFYSACENGEYNKVYKLINHDNADVAGRQNYAIALACENGHLNIVKFLLYNGADVTEYKNYAIELAIEHNHLHVVEYINWYINNNAFKYSCKEFQEMLPYCENFDLNIWKIIKEYGTYYFKPINRLIK